MTDGATLETLKAELERALTARRVLRPGGLLVMDNATSDPEQMAPFLALVTADRQFTTSLAPVGNGEFLAVEGGAGR